MSLLQMSVTGSCLIAAIAAFRGLFFRWLPKRTLVQLWTAAVLALLIPVRLSAPCSVYGLLPAVPVPGIPAAAEAAVSAVASGVSAWTGIRLGVSIALALCLAVAYGAGLTRFYRSRIIRDPWAERWLCDHPLHRYLTIRESSRVTAPVSGGILRPVILLPAGREWDEETRRCVLEHEYTHVRRLDGLVKLLCASAVCLHWFNPLAWLMALLLCRDLEYACDEAVLSGPTGRADYARAMLQAETERAARPLFANGFGAATVRRMEAVARFRRPGTALRAVSLLAAAVLVAAFATTPLRPGTTGAVRAQSVQNVNTDRSSAQPQPEAERTALEQTGYMVVVDGFRWNVPEGTSVWIVPVQGDRPGEEPVLRVGTEVEHGIYWLQTGEEPLGDEDTKTVVLVQEQIP